MKVLLGFSATKALKDAAISYKDIEQVVCGYVYGMINYFTIPPFWKKLKEILL